MANIMSMKSLKNRVSQNGFDLSKKSNFTSKCGELLPYWWKFTLPGDKWSIDLKSFTRTVPATAPAYARSRKYYDFYFVPLSLIWNKFNTTITQMNNNVQHSSGVLLEDNAPVSGYFPHCTLQEIVDYLKYLAGSSSANNYFVLPLLLSCFLILVYLTIPFGKNFLKVKKPVSIFLRLLIYFPYLFTRRFTVIFSVIPNGKNLTRLRLMWIS